MASFAEELAEIAIKNYCRSTGAMYGSAVNMAPGAGVILRNVKYAAYNDVKQVFAALRGTMLVLTHECDIEQSNARPYNKHFIAIPLVFITAIANEYEAANKKREAVTLITAAARGEISRLYYLPPPNVPFAEMDHGAIVYMNAISSNHISQISNDASDRLFSLSDYGLMFADAMLQQHLFRPKDDPMANLGPVYRPVSITSSSDR